VHGDKYVGPSNKLAVHVHLWNSWPFAAIFQSTVQLSATSRTLPGSSVTELITPQQISDSKAKAPLNMNAPVFFDGVSKLRVSENISRLVLHTWNWSSRVPH
jgi:hypothetical protein